MRKATSASHAPTQVQAPKGAPQFSAGRVTQIDGAVVLQIEAEGIKGTLPLTLTTEKIAEILAAVPWTAISDADAVEAFTEVHDALLEIQEKTGGN